MAIFGIVLILFGLWIAFEFYRAPMINEEGKEIKPGKKISDLWRKQR